MRRHVALVALALAVSRSGLALPTEPADARDAAHHNQTIHARGFKNKPQPYEKRRECGRFATADATQIRELGWELRHDETEYTVGPEQCLRVKCHDTSGIYLCNDNPWPVTKTSLEVHDHAWGLDVTCCHTSSWRAEMQVSKHHAISGQVFLPDSTNVIIGYANCKHHAGRKPSVYPAPGPNGICIEDRAQEMGKANTHVDTIQQTEKRQQYQGHPHRWPDRIALSRYPNDWTMDPGPFGKTIDREGWADIETGHDFWTTGHTGGLVTPVTKADEPAERRRYPDGTEACFMFCGWPGYGQDSTWNGWGGLTGHMDMPYEEDRSGLYRMCRVPCEWYAYGPEDRDGRWSWEAQPGLFKDRVDEFVNGPEDELDLPEAWNPY